MAGIGQPSKFVDQRKLTNLQSNFVDAYLLNGENIKAACEDIGISKHHGYDILKSERVKLELIKRKDSLASYHQANNLFNVSKKFQMQFLWNIAVNGASKIKDKHGNEVMMNPAASVKAIRLMCDLDRSWAKYRSAQPSVPVKDNRSINEVRASIDVLAAEARELLRK